MIDNMTKNIKRISEIAKPRLVPEYGIKVEVLIKIAVLLN